MKETGLIFNAEMVRAIIDGRKTQTRRVIKPQPFDRSWSRHDHQIEIVSGRSEEGDEIDGLIAYTKSSGGTWSAKCPFGQTGDRLWVRETFSCIGNEDGHPVNANGDLCERENAQRIYKASAIQKPNNYGLWTSPDGFDFEGSWTPSIHMPRWASRITLEITGVRVERLNDISPEDAESEGLERTNFTGFGDEPGMPCFPEPDVYRGTKEHGWTECPSEAFQHLWKSLYGEESWQKNPWCWVIEFKRL
ncbi:hypothetical protein [Dickeya chrysanthemi]|uniref:hypothetical protein n=1 Tax=Dickeya chrysanthemi TaxID=556 RepID=UPI001CF4C1FA|nr:hypothetical protein [Dickeya chrysanthemi]MCA7006331.1 hypothetical protein [Dickeya chrysanthemi]